MERFLDAFPTWLKSLGGDATELSHVIADEAAPEATKRLAANTLSRSTIGMHSTR